MYHFLFELVHDDEEQLCEFLYAGHSSTISIQFNAYSFKFLS